MTTIAITYIGHRAFYTDGACGSGVTFKQGQTLAIPVQFAQKMLKHPSVYVAAAKSEAESAPVVEVKDKTEDDKRNDEFNRQQDMRDTFAQMDKEALATFAKTHWRMDLDKRMKVENMRAAVIQNFDQYGIAG